MKSAKTEGTINAYGEVSRRIITLPFITKYTLEKINSRAKFLAESHITEANIDYAANEHDELYKVATILNLKKDAFKLKYILLNDLSNELQKKQKLPPWYRG